MAANDLTVLNQRDAQQGVGSFSLGHKDLGAWANVALDEALGAEAWLLGRRSYEFFGPRWRPRRGDLADRKNSLPKYVVSSTSKIPTGTTRGS